MLTGAWEQKSPPGLPPGGLWLAQSLLAQREHTGAQVAPLACLGLQVPASQKFPETQSRSLAQGVAHELPLHR